MVRGAHSGERGLGVWLGGGELRAHVSARRGHLLQLLLIARRVAARAALVLVRARANAWVWVKVSS